MPRTRLVLTSMLSLALVGFLAGFVVGCGQMTMSPVSDEVASPGAIDTGTNPGNPGGDVGTETGQSGGVGSLTSILRSLAGLVVRVIYVVGNAGGMVTNGRWHVDVPAGAIDGTATVGIGVPSRTSPDCKLEIAPLSKNHFAVPVMLTADCRSVPSSQLANYVIYWFDPVSRTWVPVAESKVDIGKKTVSAPLQHFSQYSVGPAGGKAGW